MAAWRSLPTSCSPAACLRRHSVLSRPWLSLTFAPPRACSPAIREHYRRSCAGLASFTSNRKRSTNSRRACSPSKYYAKALPSLCCSVSLFSPQRKQVSGGDFPLDLRDLGHYLLRGALGHRSLAFVAPRCRCSVPDSPTVDLGRLVSAPCQRTRDRGSSLRACDSTKERIGLTRKRPESGLGNGEISSRHSG